MSIGGWIKRFQVSLLSLRSFVFLCGWKIKSTVRSLQSTVVLYSSLCAPCPPWLNKKFLVFGLRFAVEKICVHLCASVVDKIGLQFPVYGFRFLICVHSCPLAVDKKVSGLSSFFVSLCVLCGEEQVSGLGFSVYGFSFAFIGG